MHAGYRSKYTCIVIAAERAILFSVERSGGIIEATLALLTAGNL